MKQRKAVNPHLESVSSREMWNKRNRENPSECGWNQMSLSPSLYSWRDMDSLANGNSHEAPSHRECHYSIPGSAQTYILCAWKHTHTHTDVLSSACTGMFTLQSVMNMHIQTDMSDSWICARWHIYIWAGLSWPGLWCGVTGLMPLPLGSPEGGGGGATTWQAERCISFTVTLQWHNLSSSRSVLVTFLCSAGMR